MIFTFDEQIKKLKELGVEIPDGAGLQVAMLLFSVYDKGFAEGREHAVRIVQKRATNPMRIVDEIRKPLR